MAFVNDRPEEARLHGRSAGLAGWGYSTNPYRIGSDLAFDWDDGWREGMALRNRTSRPVLRIVHNRPNER